jgi:hypothetical protein
MNKVSVLSLGLEVRKDPKKFILNHPNPWLVWWPDASDGKKSFRTATGAMLTPVGSTGSGVPAALELVKKEGTNEFPFGITIGRAENNDVVLEHDQVSRFHAYVRPGEGCWYLVDNDSRNGTYVNGEKLKPNQPQKLPGNGKVRFGLLEVLYFQPSQMQFFLEQQMSGEGGR